MPSKLPAYRDFVLAFVEMGYVVCSIAHLWERIKNDQLCGGEKYLVLRHDIDTDVWTAKEMWRIEQALDVRSSYFFRLGTVDIPFMREIECSGGEASYHYEELATVAKQKQLKTRNQVINAMPYIQDLFRRNLTRLRNETGLSMKIVASHGDFVNRKLRVYNWELLQDESFRKEMDIHLEAYDDSFSRYLSSRHAEVFAPDRWRPENPFKAAENGNHIIHVLIHPRTWYANPKENAIANAKRLWEELRYRL